MHRLTRVVAGGAVALPLVLGGAGLASANPTDTGSTQSEDRGSVEQTTGSDHGWTHIGGSGQWDHGWKHNGDHRGVANTGDDHEGGYDHHDGDDGLLGNLLGL